MRVLVLAVFLCGSACAQLPKGFYAWWSSPVAEGLNLSNDQRRDIRQTIKEYRPRLLEIRASLERAELDLETQFNQSPVDTKKAGEAIEKLAAARADLTRTLSLMSLKLRTFLTAQQWEELQRKRPLRGDGKQADQSTH